MAVPVLMVAAVGAGSACAGTCEGFDYSIASDAKGEATPADAVTAWTKLGAMRRAPKSGWKQVGTPSGEDEIYLLENGSWRVSVTPAPQGGWLVIGGSHC